MALGDSLAVGIPLLGGNYACNYYKWLLSSRFGNNLKYINLGVAGWTSGDLLCALEVNPRYQCCIKKASIITLDIGGNDILKSKNNICNMPNVLIIYESNLRAILHKIRSLNNIAELYMMDIYNPYPEGHGLHGLAEEWIVKLNRIIYSVCADEFYNIGGVAPVYNAFRGKACEYTLISYGNIHPNSAGYKVISGCFELTTCTYMSGLK